jgi:hypothetical protein
MFFGWEFIPSVTVSGLPPSAFAGDPEDPNRLVGHRIQRTNL